MKEKAKLLQQQPGRKMPKWQMKVLNQRTMQRKRKRKVMSSSQLRITRKLSMEKRSQLLWLLLLLLYSHLLQLIRKQAEDTRDLWRNKSRSPLVNKNLKRNQQLKLQQVDKCLPKLMTKVTIDICSRCPKRLSIILSLNSMKTSKMLMAISKRLSRANTVWSIPIKSSVSVVAH